MLILGDWPPGVWSKGVEMAKGVAEVVRASQATQVVVVVVVMGKRNEAPRVRNKGLRSPTHTGFSMVGRGPARTS